MKELLTEANFIVLDRDHTIMYSHKPERLSFFLKTKSAKSVALSRVVL